jgi:hypothetical protein
MEELNKSQIVLLTIFVTFITSIATGIVTVTLLSQAPVGVTKVIDHVVEKTIEKVVPSVISGRVAMVEKEKVKVISSEDLLIAAIARNQGSLWAIRGVPEGSLDATDQTFYGLGFVLTKDGVLVSDISAGIVGVSYHANDASGRTVALSLIKTDPKHSLSFFRMTASDKEKIDFVPVSLGDVNTLKIGQTIIALGGRDKSVVSVGIISSLDQSKIASTTSQVNTIYSTTDLKPLYVGSVLLNNEGEIVGMYRYMGEFGNYFPIPNVGNLLAVLTPPAPLSTTTPVKTN